MKRPPPPSLAVIILALAPPLIVMWVLTELAQESTLPRSIAIPALYAAAALATTAFATIATWWLIANPALPTWQPNPGRSRKAGKPDQRA